MLNTRLPGGFSWVGLVITLFFVFILMVFLVAIFGKPPKKSSQTQCINNQVSIR